MWQDGAARPMTAVRAAGYTSSLTRGEFKQKMFLLLIWLLLISKPARLSDFDCLRSEEPSTCCMKVLLCYSVWLVFSGSTFDPLGQSRGPAPPLEAKNEDTWVVTL